MVLWTKALQKLQTKAYKNILENTIQYLPMKADKSFLENLQKLQKFFGKPTKVANVFDKIYKAAIIANENIS